eukprot:6452098-Prymnesium_polylepis.2
MHTGSVRQTPRDRGVGRHEQSLRRTGPQRIPQAECHGAGRRARACSRPRRLIEERKDLDAPRRTARQCVQCSASTQQRTLDGTAEGQWNHIKWRERAFTQLAGQGVLATPLCALRSGR